MRQPGRRDAGEGTCVARGSAARGTMRGSAKVKGLNTKKTTCPAVPFGDLPLGPVNESNPFVFLDIEFSGQSLGRLMIGEWSASSFCLLLG